MRDNLDQKLFEVATYLVTSAPTAYDETPALVAFRMVDGANRLLSLLDDDDGFAAGARAEYAAHRNEVMTDQDAFREWLTEYVRSFAKEATVRAGSTPSTS